MILSSGKGKNEIMVMYNVAFGNSHIRTCRGTWRVSGYVCLAAQHVEQGRQESGYGVTFSSWYSCVYLRRVF